jgi:hypothetical protein
MVLIKPLGPSNLGQKDIHPPKKEIYLLLGWPLQIKVPYILNLLHCGKVLVLFPPP